MKDLSVIIPCYNEAANLPLLISRCAEVFNGMSNIEVILVDNGSSDGTQKVLQNLLPKHRSIRSIRVEVNQGYGYGILQGLKAAQGRFIGWTHADMQTDPADCKRALELILKSSDPQHLFVKGKRYGRSFQDLFFTVGMACFETILMRKRLWDINAQPNIFPKSFFEAWSNPPHDFSLDLYAYYLASKGKMQVLRLPVYFGKRAHGHSTWNVNWKAKVKFIKRTVNYSFALLKNIELETQVKK